MYRKNLKTVALYTLGCRANQVDTESICALLREKGYSRVKPFSDADLHIINTCTVTNRADSKGRQLIRKVLKNRKQGRVVVTGCSAQNDAETLSRIQGVDLILGNVEKENFARYLEKENDRIHVSSMKKARLVNFGPSCGVPEKTRANLKIQDGCDQHCAYCIIPFVRGKSRSQDPHTVLKEAGRLVRAGYREIVITGIHIGQYLWEDWNLTKLLSRLTEVPGDFRIRISSINPDEINESFLDLVLHNPKICRHLHISLQHGDDNMLNEMRRPYTVKRIREIFGGINLEDPHFGLGTDFLVGFPGEDDRAFTALYDLTEELPLTYGHVFRFSPKAGTAAARMSGRVPEKIKVQRSMAIRGLLTRKRSVFLKSLVGTPQTILFESDQDSGYISNYVKVVVVQEQKIEPDTGKLMTVKITRAGEDYLEGRMDPL